MKMTNYSIIRLFLAALSLLAGSPLLFADLKDGLVAYYPFNGNANDASGNGNSGTVVGATLTTDRFGNATSAYYFNGSQYVVVANSPLLNPTTGLTLAAWVKVDSWSTPPYPRIVSKQGSDQWEFTAQDGSALHFSIALGGTSYDLTAPLPAAGVWHHLVATYDGAAIRVYCDGAIQASQAASGNIRVSSSPVYLGALDPNISSRFESDTLVGTLDDVCIYNRALSSAEVGELYLEPPLSLNDGLVAYYPFNGNANDESGHAHNGTPVGATLTTNRFGTPGGAFYFGGNGEHIAVSHATDLNLTNGYTLAAWINFEVGGLVRPRIVDKTSYIFYMDDASGTRALNLSGSGQPPLDVASGPKNLVAGQWYFVAGTYDLHTWRLYVNGVLVGQLAQTAPVEVNGDSLDIGKKPTGSDCFKGIIDDVSIYNRALGSAEVMALYLGPRPSITVSQVRLCWGSRTNMTYQIQYRSTLTSNTWVNLGSPISGSGSTQCVTDDTAGPQRFYRLITSP